MKKLLVLGFLGLAVGLAPASAAEPFCYVAGGNLGDDGAVGMQCTITADANPHGYVVAAPNDVRIFLDVDGDGSLETLDGDAIVAEISPSSGDALAGPLDLTTGSNYTLQVINGCAGACGHIGGAALK